jgi:CHAT domain-containing protein
MNYATDKMNKIAILLLCFWTFFAAATAWGQSDKIGRDTLQARQFLVQAEEASKKGHLLTAQEKTRLARALYEKNELNELAMRTYMTEIQHFTLFRRWDSTFVAIAAAERFYAQKWGAEINSLGINLGLSKAGTFINSGKDDEGIALLDSLDALVVAQKIAMTGAEEPYLFRSNYFRGYAYMHKSEYERAQFYAQKGLEVCRGLASDYSSAESDIYYLLLDIYSFTEEYNKIKKSLSPYLKSMASRFGTNSPQSAAAYKNVGFGAYLLKDYALSSQYYETAERIYLEHIALGKEEYKMDLLRLYVNMGISYKDSYYRIAEADKKEQLKKAERTLLAAIKGLRETGEAKSPMMGNATRALGFVYYELERNVEALAYFQESVLSQIYSPTNTKSVNDLPDFSDPTVIYPNFFVLFWSIESKNSAYWASYERDSNLAHIHEIIRHLKAMETLFERNFMQIVDTKDQLKMLGQKAVFYDRWIKCLYLLQQKTNDPKYLWEAFKIAEKSKAALLFSSLRTEPNDQANSVPEALRSEENNLRSKLAEMQKRMADAARSSNKTLTAQLQDSITHYNKKFELLIQNLKTNYPTYCQWKYQREVDTWTAEHIAAQFADPKQMFIEYFVQGEKLYIFSLHQQKWQFLSVDIKPDSLSKNVNAYHKALSDNALLLENPDSAYFYYTQSARLLYEQLIAPLNIGKEVTHLTIIPDNTLHYIPFEALLTAPAPKVRCDYKNLDFLIQRFNVRYHYSMELLLLQKNKKANNNNGHIAAFAAEYRPDTSRKAKIDANALSMRSGYARQLRSSLAPLPNAIKEVEFLKANYKGDFFIGSDANERNFKKLSLQNYSILHLAMHGLVNEKNATESSLAFSEDFDKQEDNFLHAFEIKEHQIPTNLVVLSACETGCGKYASGEGVMSLARSFMYAGTPSVVMTLWSINDQTTANIMSLFYAELAKGLPTDEALRQAKLQYIATANNPTATAPMFWAPFVHIGNNSPIFIKSIHSRDYTLLVSIAVAALLGSIAFFFVRRGRKK